MEPVFYAPMAAHGLGRLAGVERRRGDVITRLEAAPIGKLGARLHTNDRGGAGQPQFAGEAPVAVEPIDFFDDADGPLFDAAMALVVVDVCVDGSRGGEGALRFGAQAGLVGLDRQQIVGAGDP